MEIYVVAPGDTVNAIANLYGVAAGTVIYDNQLIPPYQLAVGQALLINTGAREKNMTIQDIILDLM